jgi:hypothetical protein
MARRPDREKVEVLSERDLTELRYNLAYLSLSAGQEFYERAYQDCRLVLRPASESAADANASSGLEAVAEMALSHRTQDWANLSDSVFCIHAR